MMFRIGTDSFRVLLRLCRLLKPSRSSRRSTRSSTRDWEMPKSSKVCGIPGLNPLWAGAIVAAMKDSEPHSLIGKRAAFIYGRRLTVPATNATSSSITMSSAKTLRNPFTDLEQAIMASVWRRGSATAEQVREDLAPKHKLKESTIRTLLGRLEKKGH